MTTAATDEYQLLKRHVGLLDRSDRGKLRLSGADVAEFLQGQLTNDIEALTPGQGCYAALLTHKGKLRADVRVLRGEGWCLLDTEPAGHGPLAKTVQMYSIGRDVRLSDETSDRAILSLIGPASASGLDVEPADGEHSFVEGAHGIYVRTDMGVDVICAVEEVDAVVAALGVESVSAATAECLRIESGRPRYGLDMDADTIPQEAGLNDRAVSFAKGCYVGQETVARLHYKGKPNRHLRGLRLGAPAEHGDPVVGAEKPVGRIGSTCVSPAHGPIALAILRRDVGPGDTVVVGEARIAAEVVDPRFGPAD